MLVKIQEIRPSPYNPKQPLTKKQYAALKKNVEKYGFQRDLLVCKDFERGGGFICLDGHTAIELLKELGRTEIECKVVENVVDRKSLAEFITGYAVSKKPLINEIYLELGNAMEETFGKSATFFDSDSKIKFDDSASFSEEEQTQYFLTLPAKCVAELKKFVRTKAFKKDRTRAIEDAIEKACDEDFLQALFVALWQEK